MSRQVTERLRWTLAGGGLAPALAAAIALSILAGCSAGRDNSGDGRRDSRGGAPAYATTAGRCGGALVLGTPAGPKTFNPVVSSETSSSDVWQLMFDRLVGFDPVEGRFVPRLAESWEVSGDGLAWTFVLRDGLKWSDGQELTSEDVVFAFDVVYDDRVPSVGREILSAGGAPFEVVAIDRLTFKITTRERYGPMLYALASAYWPLPGHILESAYTAGRFAESLSVDTAPEDLAVSGPFELALAEPGRTVLRRNPNFWKVDEHGERLPYLDRVVFVETGDWNAWRLSFESGEVDYYQCRPEEIAEFAGGREGVDYTAYNLGLEAGTVHLWYNLNPGYGEDAEPLVAPHKREWFSNPRFRRATSHAIDRESIVRTVYHGWGEPIYGPTSPVNKAWYNPDIPRFEFDPVRAGELLEAMGLVDRNGDGIREDRAGNEVRFTILSNVETTYRTVMGNMIAGDLKRVGVDARFQSLDFNTLVTLIGGTCEYDACLLSVTAGPDPVGGMDIWLSSGWMHAFHPNQSSPATEWEAEVDRLVFENLSGLTHAERKRSWDQVQALFAENLGFIYIANQKTFIAVRNGFGNLRPQPFQEWHRAAWNAEEIYVRIQA